MRVLLASMLLLATPLLAQNGPPDSLVNTKVIPRDTPVTEVIAIMRSITGQLGVRCTDCHVGTEEQELWTLDFASDEKEMKRKARVMMEMVKAINDEHLPRLAAFDAQGLEVTCFTCHRGARLPIPLEDVLLRAHAAGGPEAMDVAYDSLRAQFFGRAIYDFGERTLSVVASRLLAAGQSEDAIRTYLGNAELFPASGNTQFTTAQALLAVGDTAMALTYFRRAVAVDPANRWAARMVARLGRNSGGS
jgi:tetratricopeptide (TPR) repeat protein